MNIKFPKHECSLSIHHNDYKISYQTIEKWISNLDMDDQIENKEIFERCIKSGNIWELTVHPLTPVGFYTIYSDTFEGLFEQLED